MPSTRNRVPSQTNARTNRRIREETANRVRYYQRHPDEIPSRLRVLAEEWDIERAIEANASALAFAGVAMSVTGGNRRWLALSALVTAFLFQHAIQGWCPPIPILRRLGFRTSYEIEQERTALKALRGDFSQVRNSSEPADAAFEAARA